MKKMKMLIWENVLTDYSSGIMVAIAPTIEEARKALLEKCDYIPPNDLNQPPQEFTCNLPETVAFLCWGSS